MNGGGNKSISKSERLFLERNEKLLDMEPVQRAQKNTASAAASAGTFLRNLPLPFKIIATLLLLLLFIVFIPLFLYAVYWMWNMPSQRGRFYHSGAVFLMGFVSLGVLYFVVDK